MTALCQQPFRRHLPQNGAFFVLPVNLAQGFSRVQTFLYSEIPSASWEIAERNERQCYCRVVLNNIRGYLSRRALRASRVSS